MTSPVRSPTVYVLGGPNGAGKTTFAQAFLTAAEIVEFLNAQTPDYELAQFDLLRRRLLLAS